MLAFFSNMFFTTNNKQITYLTNTHSLSLDACSNQIKSHH